MGDPIDHQLYLPQHAMATDAEGKLEVDIVGRDETMQAGYDEICAQLGMQPTQLELGSLVDDILAIPESVWDMEDASKPNRFKTLDKRPGTSSSASRGT